MDNQKKSPSDEFLEEKLVTKVGKLISERPKRLAGYSRAYEYVPADFFEKQYGTLYFVIEIASPDPQVLEVGDMIIEVLKGEYYADLDRDPLVSFETGLKAINKELANIAASGKTAWLNKINAIGACLAGKTLHLTQVGSAEAYLLRNDNLTHISEGLYTPSEKPNPLKTFVNIASGTLEPEDRIIISTPGLFYSVSLDNIKKIISDKSPSKAVKKLAEFLKEEEDALGTSLLVIRVTTEEQLSQEEVEEDEEIWIAEPKSKLKSFSEKTKPILARSKTAAGIVLQKARTKGKKTILPLLSKTSMKLKSLKEKGFTKTVSEPIPKPEIKEEAPKEKISVSEETITQPTEEKAPPASSIKSKISPIKEFFKNIGLKISSFFLTKKKEEPPTSDKYLYLTIIALVIFLSTLGIFYYRKKTIQEFQKAETIYNEALDNEQKAEAVLIYQDREHAKELLQKALEKAESIKENKYFKEKVAELIKKIYQQQDKVNLIYRVDKPSIVADFSKDNPNAQTSYLFIIGNDYYSFQKDGRAVYRYQSKEKKVTQVTKTLTRGNFVSGALTGDNTILLYDNGPGVSEYNPLDNSIIPQTISLGGSWEKATTCATYQNYLYVLSPQNNKIYRHARTLGGFSIGVDYLENTNLNLSNTVSLTVGETVFLLQSNGEIWQFSRGRQIPFVIKNMPNRFEKPTFIFTRSGFNNLYIIDQKKKGVVVLDLEGNYKGQYIASSIKDIQGCFVDEPSRKIYILSENKVYALDLHLE